MIDSEKVYTWLIEALRTNDELSSFDPARHKNIQTLCRVLALDPDYDVTYNDPSKVLLEARSRMFEETRQNAKSR